MKRVSKRSRRRFGVDLENSGQATVEFVLTFILFFAFVLFFFQLSLVFAFGNFAHYATFMAARAYLSAGVDNQDQQTRARDVIVALLKKSAGASGVDKFPSIARGTGGGDPGGFEVTPPSQYDPLDPGLSWMQGVRYTFKSNLFIIPLAGFGRNASSGANNRSVNSVTLTSESWLGKDPSEADCKADMGKGSWFWDNGC
jgi:hypothetical protein